MAEYIERKAAIDVLEKSRFPGVPYIDTGIQIALREIKAILAADVVPVVHAYWIPQKENHEFKEALMNCSACGYPVSWWTGNTNFCPNCGAKMDGGESDG